jgi:pimeloyl-ACP methyl ester carboxylesterase
MPAAPATEFVSVNGLRLAYQHWPGRAGAPALLGLPHLTGHKGSYYDLAAALAPDYNVYALDLRGRGESDAPADGYGFAYHAADLLACADAWGLARFGLIGHSFGATTAAYLAALRPERVGALVLLDGGCEPPAATLQRMYPTVAALARTYPSVDDYLDEVQALPYFQPWDAALERYFRADLLTLPDGQVRPRGSAAAVRRDLDQHFFYTLRPSLPAIACPTLFLRPEYGLLGGQRGQVFSEAEAATLVAALPHGQRGDVAGANHYTLLLKDGPPVLAPVRAFLRRHWSTVL